MAPAEHVSREGDEGAGDVHARLPDRQKRRHGIARLAGIEALVGPIATSAAMTLDGQALPSYSAMHLVI